MRMTDEKCGDDEAVDTEEATVSLSLTWSAVRLMAVTAPAAASVQLSIVRRSFVLWGALDECRLITPAMNRDEDFYSFIFLNTGCNYSTRHLCVELAGIYPSHSLWIVYLQSSEGWRPGLFTSGLMAPTQKSEGGGVESRDPVVRLLKKTFR